jgi:lipoprotein-anchoring transpeptidase ErfK/SrfK
MRLSLRGTAAGLVLVAVGVAGCGPANTAAPATGKAPVARVDIAAAGGDQVNPLTPIVVHVQRGTLSSVTVTSPRGKQVTGAMSADHTSWQTSEVLGYDSAYEVSAAAVGTDGQPTEQHRTIHTLTPRAQAYPSVVPAPGPHVDVGVGQPIVVRFDKTITDRAAAERTLAVTSTPKQTGSWFWISSREVHYRPENYWQPGTHISLKINEYGINLGAGVYGETDKTVDFTVHDSWVARADGNTEQMQIFQNDQLVKTMPISMGKDSTPTHIGTHVISDKQQKFTMDSCTYGVCPGQPGYYRTDEFFTERISNDGEFVHENPASVSAQGNTNVSHGCINLDQDNAEWFFAHFGLGDVVEVTNSGGPPLPVWDTYGDWAAPWQDWQAGSALH